MARVSYHQNVFDLLDYEPPVSAAALKQIEGYERCCGKPLPASVRDWYMTAGVVPLGEGPETVSLWHEYSNADHPVPLAGMLRGFELATTPGGRGQRDCCARFRTGERFVLLLIENQAVRNWWVRVDGSDDPPVWDDNGSPRLSEWQRVAPSLSAFLFDWFAAYYTRPFTPLSYHHYRESADRTKPPPPKAYLNGLYLRAPREPALLPPHLDYLIDHLEEGRHLARPKGPITYHFTAPGARLHVTTDDWREEDGHSAWWLHADSAEALEQLAQHVWRVGALAQALQADTNEAAPVLERLRQGGA
jgi:hypothetical protein